LHSKLLTKALIKGNNGEIAFDLAAKGLTPSVRNDFEPQAVMISKVSTFLECRPSLAFQIGYVYIGVL
jgi:hypothetical protein